jgi:hypothetical protein
MKIIILNVLSKVAMVIAYWYDHNIKVGASKQVMDA